MVGALRQLFRGLFFAFWNFLLLGLLVVLFSHGLELQKCRGRRGGGGKSPRDSHGTP
jgi:hypothetical protein